MIALQYLSRAIIKKSFRLSVWTIEQFHDIAIYEAKARALQELPDGTLGKEIAACLDQNKLRLVPGYESHDLKHVLLDFKMTPVDEIRMQAFMLGNGNYTMASFAIFIFGVMLLPDLWQTFYIDFKNGRQAKPIRTWTIEEYAHCQLSTLREMVFNYTPAINKTYSMRPFTKYIAYSAVIAGVLGMLFCLPFLFSSSLADLVGAGFPFLAGAVMVGCGIIALSNLKEKDNGMKNAVVKTA